MKKKKMETVVAAMAVAVAALGLTAALGFTVPYAIAMDGSHVKDPWAVTIGEKEAFLVESEADGKAIIEGIKAAYATENSNIENVKMEPEIQVVEKDLKRGHTPPQITGLEEAVEMVVAANETDNPVLVVTITEEVEKSTKIEHDTEYTETSDLFLGQEQVVEEGKDGEKVTVSKLTNVNGVITGKRVLSSAVESKPQTEVIARGTKIMSDADATQIVNNGGVAVGKGSGSSVANYALQFVGNPYKYGGTSLTSGADCSGFTMSVYSKFGIGIPRTSSGQQSCGKAVSYSEAKAGDIICYSGHVGIYIGGGKIVHASTPKGGIKVGSAHYKPIVSVRRIVQ